MGLLDNLGDLVLRYPEWSHWIIAVAILFQGEVVVLVAVFLVVAGSLTWGGFIVPAITSLIAGDALLYLLGRMIRNTRFGWRWYLKMKGNRRAQFYMYYVKENLNKLMIISKFLVATNLFAVLAASWSKVGFGRFMKSQLTSVMLWFFSTTAIAYFFASGFSYLRSEKVFRKIEIAIVVVIVLFFIGEFFMKKMLHKKIEIETNAEKVGKFIEEQMGEQ